MYILKLSVLEDAVYRADVEHSAIYADYSGRAMYGKECFGLVHSSQSELIRFVIILAQTEDDTGNLPDMSWAEDARADSMGLSTITYFPNVQVDKEA